MALTIRTVQLIYIGSPSPSVGSLHVVGSVRTVASILNNKEVMRRLDSPLYPEIYLVNPAASRL